MNRQTILVGFAACAGALISAAASAMDHFEAICDDVRVEGYQYDVGTVDGKVYSEWSKSDGFSGPPWRFRYTGGDSALVDDNEAAVAENGPVLLLTVFAVNSSASSAWMYAIHRGVKQVVAAQVNGFDSLTRGVKARAVQLECTFKELP